MIFFLNKTPGSTNNVAGKNKNTPSVQHHYVINVLLKVLIDWSNVKRPFQF